MSLILDQIEEEDQRPSRLHTAMLFFAQTSRVVAILLLWQWGVRELVDSGLMPYWLKDYWKDICLVGLFITNAALGWILNSEA